MANTPHGVTRLATGFFSFHLMITLIGKGVLSRQEAANVMVETANDIRSGTEDGPTADDGEALAQGYEKLAGQLLRHAPKL